MKSVNFALRKAYVSALSGITYDSENVNVFYNQAPDDDVTDKNYIVINGLSNNDASTLNSSDTNTSITVGIYTYADKYNSGKAADDIADIVLQRIYPTPSYTLDLSADGFQMVSTKLVNDRVDPWTLQGQKNYVDRVLTFKHFIYHLESA